jgi:hypothetical protein
MVKHVNTNIKMCCQTISEFVFHEDQIVECFFIFHKTQHPKLKLSQKVYHIHSTCNMPKWGSC